MKNIDFRRSLTAVTVVAIPAITFGAASDSSRSSAHEPHKHEILIQNESAYIQGKGETQIDIGYEIFRDKEIHHEIIDENVVLFAYEYGFSDRFQFSLEAVHISETEVDEEHHEHKASGFGDVELATAFLLSEEAEFSPQVSLVLKGILPTGDEDEGLGLGQFGWGAGLNVSKMLNDRTGIHFSTSFARIDGAEVRNHELDIEEFAYGLTTSYTASEKLVLLLEYKSDREHETDVDGHQESITQRYIAPGALIKLPHHTELGISIPVGLNDESFDWGAIVEYTVEF